MPGGASGQGKLQRISDWPISIHYLPKGELAHQAPFLTSLIGCTGFVLVDRPSTDSFLSDSSTIQSILQPLFLSPVARPARVQVTSGLVFSFVSSSIFRLSQCVVR